MDDIIIARIVQRAAVLPFEEQGFYIAREAVAAARAADLAMADRTPELESEFRAWWKSQGWPAGPGLHAVSTHVAWARHLLSRGKR